MYKYLNMHPAVGFLFYYIGRSSPFKGSVLLRFVFFLFMVSYAGQPAHGQLIPEKDTLLLVGEMKRAPVLTIKTPLLITGNPSFSLSSKDISFLPVESTSDVLLYFPATADASESYPLSPGSFITRGLKSKTGFGRRAIVFDGYRMDDVRFSAIPPNIIPLIATANTEIWPGSATMRFGDDAMGGLISLEDRQQDGYFSRAAFSYGSFNTSNIAFAHGGGLANAKYRIYATRQASDGYRANSSAKTYHFGGSIQIPVSRNSVIFFNTINHIDDRKVPGFIVGFLDDDKNYSAPVFSHDKDENSYYSAATGFRSMFNRNSLMDVKLGFRRMTGNGNHTYAGLPPILIGTTPGNYSISGSYGDMLYGNTKNTQLSGNHFDLALTIKSESPEGLGMIEGGMAAGYGTYQKSVFDIFKGFEDDYAENYQPYDSLDWMGDGYIFNAGAYLNGELVLATPLKAVAGLRYDFSTDHLIGLKPDTVLNRQFSAVTPRIGLLLSTGFSENYTGNIYANYTHAFAFPAPDERVDFTQYQYLGFVEAGPSLFPEMFETPIATDANFKNQRSRTFEIGTFQKFALKNHLLGEIALTGFVSEISNSIVFDYHTNRFNQIEKSETTGLEISARLNYKNLWSWLFNYAFADAKILSGQYEQKIIPGIPKNVASTAIIFNHPTGIYASAAMLRKGKVFLDNENSQELKGYFVFNTRAGYTIGWVTAYFDVINLFDTEHYSDGFARNGVNYLFPATVRRFNAGLMFSF